MEWAQDLLSEELKRRTKLLIRKEFVPSLSNKARFLTTFLSQSSNERHLNLIFSVHKKY